MRRLFFGGVLLTADDKVELSPVLNGDFHTVPGEGTSLTELSLTTTTTQWVSLYQVERPRAMLEAKGDAG